MNGIIWSTPKNRLIIIIAVFLLSLFFIFTVRVLVAARSANVAMDKKAVETTKFAEGSNSVERAQTIVPSEPEPMIHIPLPIEVRGIYWTAFTAATKRADELIAYIKKTGLNTVVIDLKMDNGQIGFIPKDVSLAPYAMKKPVILDLDALLKKLADDHIYRIARIAVMRDSAFAGIKTESALRSGGGGFWRDKTGSMWVDPASVELSVYSLALAREAYARGFDEVQFDYVRFASDGKISSIVYPIYNGTDLKVDVMKRFFAAVGGPLQEEKIPVSFDLFGLVCMANDGLGIGQRLEDVITNSDFVSPMVYPSHYANGFQGFANPALYPYQVVKISLDHAALQLNTLQISNTNTPEQALAQKTADISIRKQFRPWLQDFDIGAVYTHDKIEAQIKAARDAGASGWILWNARNVYEPANYQVK